MTDKLVVLNVYGSGRSGTTLIGTLLNQVEGVFYAGELQPLWGPSWLPDELCSCGKPALECPVWSRVLHQVIQDRHLSEFIAEMRDLRDTTSRARHLLFAPILRKNSVWHARQRRFIEQTEQLYRAIQHATGCRVIVDTSKWPSYSALMARYSALDWRTVHLVRDPRAVAQSWTRSKAWRNRAGSEVRQQGILQSALTWVVQNALVEALRPAWTHSLRLRYEDFTHAPDRYMDILLSFIGIEHCSLRLSAGEPLPLREHHILGANPDRLQRREISIVSDDAWRAQMPSAQRVLVWLISAPLALRYGYK